MDGVREGSVRGPEEKGRTRETREGRREQAHNRQTKDGRMKEWSIQRWCEKAGGRGDVEERRKWSGRRRERAHETVVDTRIQ